MQLLASTLLIVYGSQ